jgi:hypothetical protein
MSLVAPDDGGRFKRVPHAAVRLRPGDSFTYHAELTFRHVGRNDLTVVALDFRPVFAEPLSEADELALLDTVEAVL